MRTDNNHAWDALFAGDTCRICWSDYTTGTAKANHAAKHVREGAAIRTGEGTVFNPFIYRKVGK